jgi:hypothetical protein
VTLEKDGKGAGYDREFLGVSVRKEDVKMDG